MGIPRHAAFVGAVLLVAALGGCTMMLPKPAPLATVGPAPTVEPDAVAETDTGSPSGRHLDPGPRLGAQGSFDPDSHRVYVVAENDNISSIAQRFGLATDQVRREDGSEVLGALQIGERLKFVRPTEPVFR